MEIKNNSIIHTVRDFALENFGVELTDEQISAELRDLNFSGTLQLTNALKNNDKDLFTKYITLDLEEGYTILPPMDRERYQEREGLEGPFPLRSGKVVYYDPREGKYYDPDTDYYLSYDEYMQYDKDDRMQEMQSPGVVANLKDKRDGEEEDTVDEAADEAFEPHMMYSKDGKEEKYADTEELHLELKDKGWGHELEERRVAGAPGGNSSYGSNSVSTGRTMPKDPDDAQQDANSDASASNSEAADDNASEIARLKKLAGIK
jgi:hypothetical protein|tara:strand:+ start:1292 stop:2077 length:786 start_codon:yes stop_codon:yes gene_type:complete